MQVLRDKNTFAIDKLSTGFVLCNNIIQYVLDTYLTVILNGI